MSPDNNSSSLLIKMRFVFFLQLLDRAEYIIWHACSARPTIVCMGTIGKRKWSGKRSHQLVAQFAEQLRFEFLCQVSTRGQIWLERNRKYWKGGSYCYTRIAAGRKLWVCGCVCRWPTHFRKRDAGNLYICRWYVLPRIWFCSWLARN